jgi:acyl carrier protein
MNDTLAELNRLLRERLGRSGQLLPETELVADLALDSIQQLDLIVELENHFAIALEIEGDEGIRTVGELVACIDRARGGAR